MNSNAHEIFGVLVSVEVPLFLVGDDQDEAEVVRMARTRAEKILSEQGYLAASRMLERLSESIETI